MEMGAREMNMKTRILNDISLSVRYETAERYVRSGFMELKEASENYELDIDTLKWRMKK